MTHKELADAVGTSQSQISLYENGKQFPRVDTQEQLAAALNVSPAAFYNPAWLAADPAAQRPAAGDLAEEFVLVPHYDVEVSAGQGAFNDRERRKSRLAFRRDWLRKRGLSTDELATVSVRGDSMEPELSDGDTVLVDRSQRGVLGDDLYVLRLGNALYVKRVQRLPGGRLKVISLNPEYEPYEVDQTAPTEDFEVLGRVVWRGRDL